MPAGPLEARCRQVLGQIVTFSQDIRHSALECVADGRDLDLAQKLRDQVDIVRKSADTILEALARASFKEDTLDERLIDWLFSGGLHLCLGKLKDMKGMLKPDVGRASLPVARHLRPVNGKLTGAMDFFERNKSDFHFLVTPDLWNRERAPYQLSQSDTAQHSQETMITNLAGSIENETPSNTDPNTAKRKLRETQRRMLEEVSRWLNALDCSDKHNRMLRLHQEGTCKWLPRMDQFTKWRTNGKWRAINYPFLWLHGKSGCGKSVLIASTIEHLRTTLQREVLIFFYFDIQNERSRSTAEMMRSLLSQLCRYLIDLTMDSGDLPNKILEEKSDGTLSLDDLDKLCNLILRVANFFPREPIIVVDALDECGDIESLLLTLVRLNNGNVRWLVASRPYKEIAHHFEKLPALSFEDVDNELAVDLNLHIRQELGSCNRLNFAGQQLKDEIFEKLNQKAEGRFRWVQCQLDILNGCRSVLQVREALENLPGELEATYERILDTIDERRLEGKLARRVLVWLMVALEPLRLVQILDALSVEFSLPRKIIHEMQQSKTNLLGALSSLVSYYEKTDVIELSHASVKEYLTGRTTLPMYQIIPSNPHGEAAERCICYVSTFIKYGFLDRNIDQSKSWPMLSYVFSVGFSHLAHTGSESADVLEALQSLGLDVRHHPSHWDQLCQLRENDPRLLYPPWPSSRHDFTPYILIAYAPIELFKTFLSNHHPFKPRVGTNSLVYAADLRKTEHAIVLLAYGVDENNRSLAIDDSHYTSPLEVSIDRGDDMLVGELLQRGCPIPSLVLMTAICMPWCSARVLVRLVQTDEFVECTHVIGDERLYRGIFSSARPDAGDMRRTDKDHVALVRRLRQIGQDLSADSPFRVELIERALHAAHTSMLEQLLPQNQPPSARFLLAAATGDTPETVSVVRFLLEKGVDTTVVSEGSGDTVLHLATRCPWEPRSLELSKMFIAAGRHPHAVNTWGETPLTIAAKHGYLSVTQQLLLSDPALPSNVLSIALQQNWSPQMVQLLIHKSANLHCTAPSGESLLHLVVNNYDESSCLELVKILIEAGCNPTIQNSRHETILDIAVRHAYTSVVPALLSYEIPLSPNILLIALQPSSQDPVSIEMVQLLVQNGANLHCTTPNRESLLHLAIENEDESLCLRLMKILVEAGCNPTIPNSENRTALDIAVRRRHASMVQLLLSQEITLPSHILLIALEPSSWDPVSIEIVQLLIHKGANLHCTTFNGESLLHLAISNNDESSSSELVKILIEAGCDPTIQNSRHETALHSAVRHGHASVILVSLSHEIPLPSDILLTALHPSPSNPVSIEMVQLLIYKGANLHCSIPNGGSLLHLAVNDYDEPLCLELVKILIEGGCSLTICNSGGDTVLDIAIQQKYPSVIDFLLSQNPPYDLPITQQQDLAFQVAQILLDEGISDGIDMSEKVARVPESILHLVTAYSERTGFRLSNSFQDDDPLAPYLNIILCTAITYGYMTIVKFLTSLDTQIPASMLAYALKKGSTPQMIRVLVNKYAQFHFDTLIGLAQSYYDEPECWEICRTLVTAQVMQENYTFML